jgi:MarR family transcriptional regulator, organic hydroperoxide resistance regulator
MTDINEITKEISIMIPKLMKGAKSDFLSKSNITSAQMIMLVSIHDCGQCSLKTLANERGISPPTATGLIDRLVKAGYVKRSDDPDDRRAVIVSLTQKGKKTVENFLTTIRNRWKNILIHLSGEERQQYLNILKKIVSILSGTES